VRKYSVNNIAVPGGQREEDCASRPLADSLAAEAAAQRRLGTTADHGSAVRAFLAKEKPAFQCS
jgi:enoyl-CoA hydratase/carnithine racemase